MTCRIISDDVSPCRPGRQYYLKKKEAEEVII
jgi:hypothetical protein